jgi:TBC1 domain family protein 5
MPEVKEIMTNILFTWSKENLDLSYKQGMNELLGIFIYIAYCETIDPSNPPLSLSKINAENASFLQALNSKSDLEADVYWCFSRLMDLGIRDLFNPVVTHQKPMIKKQNLFTWEAETKHNDLVNQDKSNESNVSSILRRSHKIHHQLLKSYDPELYKHLEKHQIEPQMYLQRWLRCILTREFGLSDCLTIWDALFACYSSEPSKELDLLDFMCVSMITFVKSFCIFYIVLQSDHFGILRRLFKFPPVEDIYVIINIALRLRDPKKYVSEVTLVTDIGAPEENYSNDLMENIDAAIEHLKILVRE